MHSSSMRMSSRSGGVIRMRHTQSATRPVVIRAAASAVGTSGSRLELHMDQTTLSLPFTREAALDLDAHFTKLLQTFAAKAKAERPKRWDAMDYKLQSSAAEGGVELLELYCNANAYDTPFNAKLLITLRHEGIKFATEAKLYSIKSDLDVFLQS